MGSTGAAVRAPGLVSFRTDDLDEAGEFLRRNFADHSRVPRRRGPLGFRLDFSAGTDCASGSVSFAIPSTVRTTVRSVIVHLPERHGAAYRVGRRQFQSAPDVAVLLAPDHDYTVETPPGAAFAILLDQSLLDQEFEALGAGHSGARALRSMALPLSPVQSAALRRLIERHRVAIGVDAGAAGGRDLHTVERRMASWLVGRLIAVSGLRTSSATSRRQAQLVESWIRRHVAEPIKLEQLSAVSGLGVRALQKACLAHWGQTPLELVASRRLELARRLLATPGATRTVTEAAARAGFTHLGRFAVQYRQAFGESPSDTLSGGPAQGQGAAVNRP